MSAALFGILGILGVLSVSSSSAKAVPPGEIVLGDVVVFRFRTPSGGLYPAQRADRVQERLNGILAIPDLTTKDIVVLCTKYGPTIYVRDIKLVTVDGDTAAAQGRDSLFLARAWAHRLAGVLPQVTVRLPLVAPGPGTR